ncbi:HxlR-like helix-turn-helix [Caprobacter fermentans]|uniref:Helix-turn-helix transcriptional regulator n=1 Tax=Caproicibacter fermentans TaxID=2576756 RepID=A0A6N8I2A7_9FIRM|nr:helix-turn-helix domain-containing protein [Caproicibacter fermentans]MVB12256.1 HxlR-like helix-turn-helix [Caproicibacter fermentans]QNK39692.1 helix-turn-helix transcriptional regulator [Caproicibacter fermentans]
MKKKKKREKRSRQEEPVRIQPEIPPAPQPEDDAPLRDAVSLVGGKWKLRILWALRSGEPARYGEIRQRIPGITDMMLSQSLRELTADGLIERRQYQEIPPRVEYAAAGCAAGLYPALELFCDWVKKQKKGG